MSGAALLCGVSEDVQEGLIEAAGHIGVLFQIQDDILDIYGAKGRGVSASDIGEGKRSVLVVHCLERLSAEDAAWLEGVLDKPRERTGADDIAGVLTLFERTASLTFARGELARRKAAALAVPALAAYPVLLKMLGGACDIFIQTTASIAQTRASKSAAESNRRRPATPSPL